MALYSSSEQGCEDGQVVSRDAVHYPGQDPGEQGNRPGNAVIRKVQTAGMELHIGEIPGSPSQGIVLKPPVIP